MHNFDGNEEKYYGRGGKPGDLEWSAFLGDCEHEIETVSREQYGFSPADVLAESLMHNVVSSLVPYTLRSFN